MARNVPEWGSILSQFATGRLAAGLGIWLALGAGLSLCRSASAQPPHDACSSPLHLGTGPIATTWDNSQATTDGPAFTGDHDFCGGGWLGDMQVDLWFTWTPGPDTYAAEFSLCTPGAGMNGVLSSDNKIVVYDTTACAALTPANVIACDDDSCVPISAGLQAVCTGFVTPGNTYLIQAGSYDAISTGSWNLTISPAARPVTNLQCEQGPGPDDYTIQFDYPPGAGPGDSVEIFSAEPGVSNPIALLPFPTDSHTTTLLPANQGLAQAVQVDAVLNDGGFVAEAEVCFASMNPELRDECAAAMIIGAGDIDFPFDNTLATTSPEPGVSGCPWFDEDLWGIYVATAEFTGFAFTHPSGWHQGRRFAIYESCFDATQGNEIECRAFPSGASELVIPTVPGTLYWLRLATDLVPGPGVMHVRAIPPAAGDECWNAPHLGTGSLVTTISTAGATTGSDPDHLLCGSHPLVGPFRGDVWYRWVADDHRVFVEWEGVLDLIEPALAVYSSCLDAANGNAIVCREDVPFAHVSFLTTPGDTYWLRLASTDSPTGGGQLRITSVGPLTNDDCATPVALGVGSGSWSITNIAATSSNTAVGPCPSLGGGSLTVYRDVFYSWVADDEIALIEWSGSTAIPKPALGVYDDCASVTAGVALDCEIDFGTFPTMLTMPTIPGATYLLQLADREDDGSGGFGSLTITTSPSAPNDECLSAVHLGTGDHVISVDLAAGASTGTDPIPATCTSLPTFQHDLWYSWVAHTEFVRIDWGPAFGAVLLPTMALYRSCSDASAGIAAVCPNAFAVNTVPVVVGQTYWFRLSHTGVFSSEGVLEIQGVQLGAQNVVCNEGTAPGDYELSWTAPPAVQAGDSFVVTSNEAGVANPLYVGVHGTSPPVFSSTLLPSNQGFTLSVTFDVEYTTTIGVGASSCAIVFEPVPGDACADAIPLGSGEVTTSLDYAGATLSPAPGPQASSQCSWHVTQDLWFEWTADAEFVRFVVSAAASPQSNSIAVYESCADATTGIAVGCYASSNETHLALTNLAIGHTYLIRVGRRLGTGPTQLSIEHLTSSVPLFSCDYGSPTLTTPGNIPVPSALLQWSWPVGAMFGDVVELSSDEPGLANPVRIISYPHDSATYQLHPSNAGQPHYVRFELIYTMGSSSSAFARTCAIDLGLASNDECAHALPVGGPLPVEETVHLGVASSSAEPNLVLGSCHATTLFREDTWLQWTATTRRVRMSWTSQTMPNPVFAVYESCPDALAGVAIACHDVRVHSPSIDVDVVVGQDYWIRVGRDRSLELGEGVFRIESTCVPPSHGAVDFDCANQVVTLSWLEQDDYSAFELLVNGVPVAQPPVPAGLGNTNSYIDVTVLPNTTMHYELRAICAGGDVVTLERSVDTVTPAGFDNLVLFLAKHTSLESAELIEAELLAGQQSVAWITDPSHSCLDQLIADAANIWVVAGTESSVSATTGDRLYQAVRSGKNCFLQGAAYWAGHDPSDLDQVDGIDSSNVASGNTSMTRMRCFDGSLTQLGAVFPTPLEYFYPLGSGTTSRLAVATASAPDPGVALVDVIHRNSPDPGEDGYVVGTVALTTSGSVVIASTFELSDLVSSAAAPLIIAEYIEVFASYPLGFRRADCDNDGVRSFADALALIALISTGSVPDCLSACDVDDDGGIGVTDIVELLTNLFHGVPPGAWNPPVVCGNDPTPDTLSCLQSACP